jgi:N6-L-threonylcarbamoyladenine synthase
MKILAIESSCDETAAALLQVQRKKSKVLSSVVFSQIKTHQKYGGIVPEVAAREHIQKIITVISESLGNNDIDLIAATYGPGLITSLQVGLQTAKTLSYVWKKPLVGINHLEAHIYANWLSNPGLQKMADNKIFPAVCLIISGGHTELILMKGFGRYKLLGQTRDDAVGEAYDKVAKMLHLGYPGGPVVERLAKHGHSERVELPRPMIDSGNFDFSFSGIKTAVRYYAETNKILSSKKAIADVCASFQQAVSEVLIFKTIKAAKQYKVKTILLGGGVSANLHLRESLKKESKKIKLDFYCPEFKYTQDNAAMIAVAAYFNRKNAKLDNWKKINADPNLRLAEA